MAVRRESVVLDLDDRLTPGLIRAAAAAGALNHELNDLDGQSVKTSRSISDTEGEVKKLGNTSRSGAKDVELFGGHVAGIAAAAIAGTSALIPLAGAAAGVAAAFAAPLAFVGGGLTLFGVLDSFAIAKTQKQLQGIDQLKTKLAGLKKGTADYAATQKQLTVAQKALTPAQKDYASSLDNLHASFDKFLGGKSGDELLGPIAKALDLAADLLPKVEPIIGAVSGGLETLLGDLSRFSKTNEFSSFIKDVSQQIGPDLVSAGHILGDFTEGIGNLLVYTGKHLSPGLIHDVENLGSSFSGWANSKDARHDMQSFIDYFHKIGPGVGQDIDAVAHALGHTVKALAPLGPPTLAVVKGIADAISGIPTGTLTALSGAFVGLVALNKVKKGAGFLSGGLSTLTGGGGPLGVQKVFVVNQPTGLPGAGGGKVGDGTPLITKLALGPAALAGTAIIGHDVIGKLYGQTAANVFSAINLGILHIPFMPPDAIAKQAQVWNAAFTGHFSKALDILNAPGPVDFNIKKPSFGGLFGMPSDGPKPESVKAVGTATEALTAQLGKASAAMDLVGHSADRAFPGATHQVETLSGKMASINAGHASAAIDLVGHSASTNFAQAGGAVENFKGKLNSVPSNKKVTVTADTGQSLGALRAVAAELAAIRSKTITLTTERATGGHSVGGIADGGTVPGTRYPYGDKVFAHLAPGEEVISNRRGQADHLRRTGRLPGFADGTGGVGGGDGLGKRIADLTKAIQKDTSSRDALRSQEQQIAQSVSGSFRSDLFAASGVWGQQGGPNGTLNSDIANVRKFNKALHLASKKGLSGGAFAALATSGNLQAAQFEAGQTRGQLAHTEHLFQLRNRLTSRTGRFAGQTVDGAKLDAIRDEIRSERGEVVKLRHELAHVRHEAKKNSDDNAHKVSAAVGGGVRNAVRRGGKPS